MCGILGIQTKTIPASMKLLEEMTRTLTHRGPDAQKCELFPEYNVGLGHTRLSIIDLTESGNQPMSNQEGSIWVVFNGEIYNHVQLRSHLQTHGHKFNGSSDTEVIIHSYQEWGIDCVKKFDGMFAFGIWDKNRETFFLARDRLGIKPLVYYLDEDTFIFASEIKAILAHPGIDKTRDDTAIYDYLTYGYMPSPKTPYKRIRKLEAAHTFTFRRDLSHYSKYWDIDFQSVSELMDIEQATELVSEQLSQAVKAHLVSDVPIGAFLSGGVDSGTVVARASSQYGRTLRTYTVDFGSQPDSESQNAVSLSKLHGTQHRAVLFDELEIEETYKKLQRFYDEPLGDISILPTSFISAVASEDVKVVLSGDGGDEIFGGYERYRSWMARQWVAGIPTGAYRNISTQMLRFLHPNSSVFRWGTYPLLSPLERYSRLVTKYRSVDKEGFLNRDWLDQFRDYDDLWLFRKHWKTDLDPISQAQYLDLKTYLTDDLMAKVDQASMASSLEVRPPLLDHHLVETLFSIPMKLRWSNTNQKILLKRSSISLLPMATIKGSKIGFGIPSTARRKVIKKIENKMNSLVQDQENDIFSDKFYQGASGHNVHWNLTALRIWMANN
ncbi:MAG: asparagine synthase (glutamine-hydrolyzing) [SAR202 cluster bacterium]|nr:asparagine synthase (glutamine-hydrolyzing) [SAR202 cluster bacterium]